MHRRLGDRLSVGELAAEARLSPSYLAAAFKRKTGFAVLDFFLRLKMQRACLLLDSTGLPVKSIAADLGFDDPLYFSRCFHRVHECSPTQYRAARKG
jgi:AraC-like DNA-binding protein